LEIGRQTAFLRLKHLLISLIPLSPFVTLFFVFGCGCAALGKERSKKPLPDKEQPRDTVCHVADLHFWKVVTNPLRLLNKRFLGNLNLWLRRRREFNMDRAEPFADALAATGITQVLLTGDFSSTALEEEFAMAAAFVRGLRRRGLEVALMPGNHDVYTFEACRKGHFERHFEEFLPKDGYPTRLVLPGGTPLILVPTAVPNPLSARGRVTRKTLEVVRALLDDCPAGPVLVAAHYPLRHRTAHYASPPQHRLRNAAALRELLGKSDRRILYVAGHVHRFSYVRDAAFPTLEHLTTGAFFRENPRAGEHGEFTEIQVLDTGFKIFRHCREQEWIRRTIDIPPE